MQVKIFKHSTFEFETVNVIMKALSITCIPLLCFPVDCKTTLSAHVCLYVEGTTG